MSPEVPDIFAAVVDLSGADRDRYFKQHGTPPELRAEVESLLQFDSHNSSDLTGSVRRIAQKVLPPEESTAPVQCGPYKLIRIIGTGGMGAVYLAERIDGEIRQQVAVKLLRCDIERPAWRERFLRERQLLANLSHPSIATLLDAGHAGDRPYLVLEYIDGIPIDAYARQLDIRGRVAIFIRTCEGVSHAHRHLIIHRDLKPSNILVDTTGQPKLLDFGIAKVLSDTTDATRTVERMLTPGYASPEQLRGAAQTTATDVYSLGAVLYKILTGHSPHEGEGGSDQAIEIATGSKSIPPATRFNPSLPADLDSVLRKALRHEPEERYATVDEFTTDLRAFLEHKPVLARAGDKWYVTRKLLRRYWVPATAAAVTVAGLTVGLLVANSERAKAQKRFEQVRHLANQVLALDNSMMGLQGATEARHEIVRISKEYLEALEPDTRHGQDFALEIATSYIKLASVQGLPTNPNLGKTQDAEESLRKAQAIIDRMLSASPRNSNALLASATIAEGLMILADSSRRDSQAALAHGRKGAGSIDALLTTGKLSDSQRETAARILFNVALMHKNQDLFAESARYSRKASEIIPDTPTANLTAADGLSVMADSLRLSGDPEAAIEAMRQAHARFDRVTGVNYVWSTLFNIRWREGLILGGQGGLNLNRTADALASFEKAWQLVEKAAQQDARDSRVRILSAQAARELGAILHTSNPQRALTVYDQAIHWLREVKNNPRARRGEAELLAGSAYPLRLLNRPREAKSRIDEAFQLLSQLKRYPLPSIRPADEAETVLRSAADHYADTGDLQHAIQLHQELLEKILASKPDPEHNLRHAKTVAAIYASLAEAHHKNGQEEESRNWSGRRLALWQQWDQRLPNKQFIRRQLDAARPQ
ncbi:MAG: serine/threonine protein kinase [Acidobacteria bacterium]|nr:serine/threonine protein kinase [Acidobacteriota bacterium]